MADVRLECPRDDAAQLHNFYYSHRAFSGLAPVMWEQPLWRAVTRHLQPRLAREVARLGRGERAAKMKLLESNPVLAAFGSFYAMEKGGERPSVSAVHGRTWKAQAIEWDVYMDEAETTTREMDATLLSHLTRKLLIGHGDVTDMVRELVEGCGVYDNIETNPKYHMLTFENWMVKFGRAIAAYEHLKGDGGIVPPPPALRVSTRENKRTDGDEMDINNVWARVQQEVNSIEMAVHTYERVFGQKLRVVLDLKCQLDQPTLLFPLIRHLEHSYGIEIEAVGSFSILPQTLDNIAQRLLFHFGVENIIESRVEQGAHILVSGASLIKAVSNDDGSCDYVPNYPHIMCVKGLLQQKNAKLGFWLQEAELDARAAGLLFWIANHFKHIFELGFAYGGSHSVLTQQLPFVPGTCSSMGGRASLSLTNDWRGRDFGHE